MLMTQERVLTNYRSLDAFAQDYPDDADRIISMCFTGAEDNVQSQFKEYVLTGARIRPDIARKEAENNIRDFAAMRGIQID